MPFTHSRAWLGALLALACISLAHPAHAQNSVNINSYSATPSMLPYTGGTVAVTANVTSDYGVDTVEADLRDMDGHLINTYDMSQQAGTDNYNTTIPIPANTTFAQVNYVLDIVATDLGGFLDERQTNLHVAAAPANITVTSLTLNPNSLTGGATSMGTVTISMADTANLAVSLSSDNAEATVPASVTVPAGATTATFTVTTAPTATAATANITAALNGTSATAALSIHPPFLKTLTIAPASVTGGTSAAATVTLSGVVASGSSVTVALSVPAGSPASVPASVTVVAGAKTASATVNTTAVSSSTTVTVTATAAGITRTATVAITPPSVASLLLNPNSLTGGASSTGTVTLTGPAPAGGFAVSLFSNTTEATVPATLTIAAGSATGTFMVATGTISVATSATIKATGGGAASTATLSIHPPFLKSLTINPATIVAGASSTGTVTLSGKEAAGATLTVALSVPAGTGVTVPASVTVPSGASSMKFEITTTPNTPVGSVPVTATAAGITKGAILTVTH